MESIGKFPYSYSGSSMLETDLRRTLPPAPTLFCI